MAIPQLSRGCLLLAGIAWDLILYWHDEYWDLALDPDILLFEDFGADRLAGFANRFYWHASTFGSAVKFVCSLDDFAWSGLQVGILWDLHHPTH